MANDDSVCPLLRSFGLGFEWVATFMDKSIRGGAAGEVEIHFITIRLFPHDCFASSSDSFVFVFILLVDELDERVFIGFCKFLKYRIRLAVFSEFVDLSLYFSKFNIESLLEVINIEPPCDAPLFVALLCMVFIG